MQHDGGDTISILYQGVDYCLAPLLWMTSQPERLCTKGRMQGLRRSQGTLHTAYPHVTPNKLWRTFSRYWGLHVAAARAGTLSKRPLLKVRIDLFTGSTQFFPKNCVKVADVTWHPSCVQDGDPHQRGKT